MGKAAGAGLRGLATFNYLLCFLFSAAILGIYSFYIARLHQHNMSISYQNRAIEGLAGGATLYSMFAILLTCFLGGVAFFAFLGMALDLICCGAMIAIAVLARRGAHICGNNVNTTLGSGLASGTGAGTNLGIACKLDFSVVIIACAGALVFLAAFIAQLLINRNHAKEKHIGHSPDADVNNEKGGFFGRKKAKTTYDAYGNSEMNHVAPVTTGAAIPVVTDNVRDSHNTAFTGSTVTHPIDNYVNGNVDKYETHPPVPAPVPQVQQQYTAPPPVQQTTISEPAYQQTWTETKGAVYDPNATLDTTGPAGFVKPETTYVPQINRNF